MDIPVEDLDFIGLEKLSKPVLPTKSNVPLGYSSPKARRRE